ncbi:hypothetical protein [Nioella nitratireducens]|uniref:hypothetical protein n=1 Tax=Nioella nitratireducens TaxID=1287720 RepID=UPI0008FD58AC|nr:hypothetical protein [Nioella nitratireducens]
MTALSEYERLETTGLWRDTPDSQRREVVVSLGDATLVIYSTSETALSHWSLPAVKRLNPGKLPAFYAPDADADELLELTDPDMIEAIERVRTVIERRRPHPGRLRLWLGGALSLAVILICVVWLPSVLMRQTAVVLPTASRAAIGQRLLTEMATLTGRPCTAPAGLTSMRELATGLFGATAPPQVIVLPSTAQTTAHLPGNILVVNRSLVEDYEGPEVLAGFLLAEDLRRRAEDPILTLLHAAGVMPTIRLLTTGEIDEAHLRDHAAALLTTPPAPVDTTRLLARFEQAGLSSEPYAYAIDVSGESVLEMIEADPMRGRLRAPLLSDQQWIALQELCDG